jgi:formylmethanofuran dehydrogenase subunit C
MAGVVLTLKVAPTRRIDLAALHPAALAGTGAAVIERMSLGPCVVGDLFGVRPGDTAELTIEGGSPLFDGAGAGMASGMLRIEGGVGALAAQGMTGGHIIVNGSAGPFAAAGMRGGLVEIRGDAGDDLGGVPPDGRTGMAGGSVLVRGNAGARAGDRMRRGTVVVEGAAGPHAAGRMIAGTLAVCGAAGTAPGVLMRRGTLLLGTPPAVLPPGFVPTFLAADGVFLRLLARALHGLSPRAAACVATVRHRALGDQAGLGKGEILLATPGAAGAL